MIIMCQFKKKQNSISAGTGAKYPLHEPAWVQKYVRSIFAENNLLKQFIRKP